MNISFRSVSVERKNRRRILEHRHLGRGAGESSDCDDKRPRPNPPTGLPELETLLLRGSGPGVTRE